MTKYDLLFLLNTLGLIKPAPSQEPAVPENNDGAPGPEEMTREQLLQTIQERPEAITREQLLQTIEEVIVVEMKSDKYLLELHNKNEGLQLECERLRLECDKLWDKVLGLTTLLHKARAKNWNSFFHYMLLMRLLECGVIAILYIACSTYLQV